jgi:hypothetical protein
MNLDSTVRNVLVGNLWMLKNNKPQIRDKRFNDFLATNLDATLTDRYCTKCHLKLIHNPRNKPVDRYIYSCPQCNCTVNIHNTEPSEKIVTTFPTQQHVANMVGGGGNRSKLIVQPDDQRLSRSKYFIQKRLEEKSKAEGIEDPYLAILKRNNQIKITNVEYFSPEDYEDE